MSFRWNFPIFFRNCGVEANIRPAIYHFMSKPKPWDGTFPPWSRKFYRPYLELLAEFPDLAAYAKPMPLQRKLKYLTQQNIKRLQETFAWRLSPRRQGILTYEAAAKY
jgi:lipopolysaccharide biosynthesis glycosyltransferase